MSQLANWQIDKSTNRQIGKLANWQIGKSANWQIDKSTNWQIINFLYTRIEKNDINLLLYVKNVVPLHPKTKGK